MKGIPEYPAKRQTCGTPKLSFGTSAAAWLTGSSISDLALAPDAEQRAVRLAGLSLVLITLASAIGWWVALGIARAEYTPWNLPYAVLVGVLVYTVDRAMLRALWFRAGLRAAKARGFQVMEREAWLTPISHGLLRVAVSVIVSLTTASFIELEVFRQDTDAYLVDQNRERNQPVFQAAAERVDAQIQLKRNEIARLDERAASFIQHARRTQTTALAAAAAQAEALISERAALRDRVGMLSRESDCQTTNRAAEETGDVRCDGVAASAGTGTRHRVAGELAEYARAERASAETRIAEIDVELAQLQAPATSPAITPEAQVLLNQIAASHSRATQDLERLVQDRDQTIRDSAERDAAFAVISEGLIVRGEALDALAKSSPWLAVRILLVMLSLVVLDLAAIFVITVQPAPRSLVVGEVLASEIVLYESIARAEQAICQAKQSILDAREMTTKTEDEVDQRITSLRRTMKTRKILSDRIDGDLKARFDEAV